MSDVVATGLLNIEARVDTAQTESALRAATSRITAQTSSITKGLEDNFSSSFKRIGTLTDNLNSKIGSGLKSGIDSGTRALTTFAAVGGTALAGLVGRAIQLGTSFNELQNKTTNALTALTGSASTASALLANVNKVAANSPFQTEAFLQGAQRLAAFGAPLKSITPLLQGISSAEAAVGGSSEQFNQVVNSLGRVELQGKFTTRSLFQLANQGIDAASIIGQQMGKTGDQIRTGITKGTIPAQAALDALATGLQQKFGGAADLFTNTLPGALEHFKKALTDLGGQLSAAFVNPAGGGAAVKLFNDLADILQHLTEVGKPVFDLIKQIADNFGNAADQAKNFIDKINLQQVTQFAATLKDLAPALILLSGAFGGFATKLGSQIPVVGGFIQEINPLAGAFIALAASTPAVRDAVLQVAQAIGSTLKPIIADLGPVLKTLQDAFGQIAASLGTALASTITALAPSIDALAKAFGGLLVALAPTIAEIVGGLSKALVDIAPVLKVIIDGVTGFINILGPFAPILAKVAVAVIALAEANKVLKAAQQAALVIQGALILGEQVYTAVTTEAGAATAFLDAALAPIGGTIGAVILVVAALGAAIFEAYQHIKVFHDAVNAVASTIASVATGAFKDFKGAFNDVTGAGSTVFSGLKTAFTDISNVVSPIVDTVKNVFDKISSFVAPVIPVIESIAKVFGVVALAISALPLAALVAAIGTVIVVVGEVVTHFGDFVNILKDVASAIGGFLIAAFKDLATIVGDVATDVAGVLTAAFNVLKNIFQDVAGIVSTVIVGAFNILKGIVTDVANAVSGPVTTAFNDLKTVFDDIGGFIDKVVSKLGDLLKAAEGLPGIKQTFDVIKGAIDAVGGAVDGIVSKFKSAGNILSHVPGLGFLKSSGPSTSTTAAPAAPAAAPAENAGAAINDQLAQIPTTINDLTKQLAGQLTAVQTLTKQYTPLIDASQKLKDAQQGVVDATKTLTDAQFQLTTLERNRTKLLDDVGASAREFADAQRAIIQTENQLRDIEQQRTQVLHDLAEAQQTAAEKIAKSQRDQITASLDLQDAQRQELILQRELNGFQAVSVNLAGLSLDQARVRLANTKETLQTQQQNSAGVNIGGTTQAQLQEQFTRAQLSTKDAQDKVTDSVRATADLQLSINNSIRDDQQKLGDLSLQQDQANEKLQTDQLKLNELKKFGTDHDQQILDINRQIHDQNIAITKDELALTNARKAEAEAAVNLALQQAIINNKVQDQINLTGQLLSLKTQGVNLDKASATAIQDQLAGVNDAANRLQGLIGQAGNTQQQLQKQQQLLGLTNTLGSIQNANTGPLSGLLGGQALNPIQSSQLTQALQAIRPLVLNLNGGGPGALTDQQIQDAVNQLLQSPGGNLHDILKAILAKLGLQIQGFAQGGLIESETFARIGEAGREAVLPLTRPARMADLLSMPEVLHPILAALPRITLPSSVTAQLAQAGTQYGMGGGVNWDLDRRRNNEELASEIARAMVKEFKNAEMAMGNVTVNQEINPSRMMNENDFVRKVSREVAKAIRNELR